MRTQTYNNTLFSHICVSTHTNQDAQMTVEIAVCTDSSNSNGIPALLMFLYGFFGIFIVLDTFLGSITVGSKALKELRGNWKLISA